MRMVPFWFLPAPWCTSANPAASASLITQNRRRIPFWKTFSAFFPTHRGERFTAVPTTPRRIGPGNPAPTGPACRKCWTIFLIVRVSAPGVAGLGVGKCSGSPFITPAGKSTKPPLTPVPPISIPKMVMRTKIMPFPPSAQHPRF